MVMKEICEKTYLFLDKAQYGRSKTLALINNTVQQNFSIILY